MCKLFLSVSAADSAETLQLIHKRRFVTENGDWNEQKSISQKKDSGVMQTLEWEGGREGGSSGRK